MIERLLDYLYRIEVPLPNSPLRVINAYVVTSRDRNLVVDTGMNRPECRAALEQGFEELGLDRERTDYFITHFHADHLGLVSAFASNASRVYFNEPEARWIQEFDVRGFLVGMMRHAKESGFTDEHLERALMEHPGIKFSPRVYPEFTIVGDGDGIQVGDYRFICMSTPGHSPGHLCLYEESSRVLVSGDHVLGDITPNIAASMDGGDMLGLYLASLDRVARLEVNLVLPGHRRVFHDLRERAGELKKHHEHREGEVLNILHTGDRTAWQTAAQMTWAIVADSWEVFPLMQKWFAVGEAAAHLIHLEAKGRVRKSLRDGMFIYSLA